ncbi:unnamed protein product [Ilex paraguariensis]|uniref:Uncharacterized protein n=1 Tax=Ilex paraguariensis TaxID=185542 RepID=A0ABC8QQC1_9AQUA
MLETPTAVDSSSSTANIAPKRYAPPNQRNRQLGRRKSGGDRLERANTYQTDGEKHQNAALKNVPIADHWDGAGNNYANDNLHSRLIPLQGCCNSEAFQLLNNRWTAAMNAYSNPSIDLAERPVLYTGSGAPAWGHVRLPHQLMSPTASVGPPGSQMDFLDELWRKMQNAKANPDIQQL